MVDVVGSWTADSESEQAVLEFVSALVHLVLYKRSVYPVETFERRRLFDLVVYRCAHYSCRGGSG